MLSHSHKSSLYIILATCLLIVCSQCTPKIHNRGGQEIDKQSYVKELKRYAYNGDTLKQLLKNAEANQELMKQLLIYKALGNHQRVNSQFSDAIESHRLGLDLAIQLQDTIEIVQMLNNLGTDFRRIGALSEASQYHFKAISYAEMYEIGDHSTIALKNKVQAYNGIGNISLSLGYYDDAEKYFRLALKGEEKLNSALGKAINYANLGAIYENKHEYKEAREYYERSMEENKVAKSDMGIGLCYIHFGDLYFAEKKFDEAKEMYTQAYTIMHDISDRWHWLEACLSLAKVGLATNDGQTFHQYIKLAEETAIAINSPEHESLIFELKHEQNIKEGNYLQALDNYKRSQRMQDTIQGIRNSNRYVDLRVNYEREQNQKHLEEVQRMNSIRQLEKERSLYISWIVILIGGAVIGILYYAYRQRSRSNKLLKEVEHARTEFFTNITHEFRTPLTVIQGLNKQLNTDTSLSQEQKKSFREAIDRQCHNMLNLVNQLLDIARLKAGIDQIEWRHGDIVPYVHMITEPFALIGQETGVQILFKTMVKTLPMDFIPSHIDKIMSNLISNAIKHTSAGDTITCEISHNTKKEEVIIEVSDTGEGIAKEDLNRIFNLFYQSPNSTNPSGSGIGLSFTQLLVEKMNGHIDLTSELGKGSTFSIHLPVRDEYAMRAPMTTPTSSSIALEQKDMINTPSKAEDSQSNNEAEEVSDLPIVLVVEDNEDIILYIRSLLDHTYHVEIAHNGKEGLEKAEELMPDMIVTDVMMPIMDGFELCCKLKESPILNHIPIIILTAKDTTAERLKGLSYGADVYLKKPFEPEELTIHINNIFDRREILRKRILELHPTEDETKEKAPKTNLGEERQVAFIQSVNKVIEMNIHDDITTDFLAEQLGLNATQLNRKLNSITGNTAVSYILYTKLQKAKYLLRIHQDRPIKNIAIECGFYDANYFSRAFKKAYNITPRDYQRDKTRTS